MREISELPTDQSRTVDQATNVILNLDGTLKGAKDHQESLAQAERQIWQSLNEARNWVYVSPNEIHGAMRGFYTDSNQT